MLTIKRCAGGFGIAIFGINLVVRKRKIFDSLYHYKSKWLKYLRLGNIVISNQ